jgi:transcriptional regulator GlxA family with amidase domain
MEMNSNRKIALFIPPRVQLLDLCGPAQVFYEANCYGASYDLCWFSLGNAVTGIAGLPIRATQSFRRVKLKPGDFIILPGAEMEFLQSRHLQTRTAFFNWLIKNYEAGVNICTICTGAFFLAATGLLDNKKCTTHWKRIPELKAAYPKVQAIDDILYTRSDRLWTSAGITAGIDLAITIVEEHYGAQFANKVSRELVVYYRRSGSHPQQDIYLNHRNHIYSGIHAVQDWLTENLEKKHTNADLAAIANMSERNLGRVFKKATGMTIQEYTKALRLSKLQILKNTNGLNQQALAGKLGYKSDRQLRRIQKKM